MLSTILFSAVLLAQLSPVKAVNYCTNYYGGYYECSGSGLTYAARWGIAVGAVALVFLILSLLTFLRKRKIRKQNIYYAQQQEAELGNRSQLANPNAPYTPPQMQQQAAPATSFGGFFGRHHADTTVPPPAYPGPPKAYAPPAAPFPGNNNMQNVELNPHEDYERRQHEENLRLEAERQRAV